jgi:Zn-dependent peptidase ImmA (M78 family)
MTTEAFITPALLRWARERDRLSAKGAAERLKVPSERLDAWEQGTARPTFVQAQALARRLHIPFGFLFLSKPPLETLQLPDLRTLGPGTTAAPSPELLDVVSDALAKQAWYQEFLQDEGAESLPFIGKYSLTDTFQDIAADIRNTIGINSALRDAADSADKFLSLLSVSTEAAGVLVLRNGVVGNNTHRPLDVQEFRGFAVSDTFAPLVFINGQDGKAAQIFTLAHELAHLWIGQSGISNIEPLTRQIDGNRIEVLCNRAAAEILMPLAEFMVLWRKHAAITDNAWVAATRFRVSPVAALRQALDAELCTEREYWAAYRTLAQNTKRAKAGGGGDFYRTLLVRNSATLTRTLAGAVAEGRVPYTEAAQLLNIQVGTVSDVTHKLLDRGS